MADIERVFEKLDKLIESTANQSEEQQKQTMQVWKSVSQSLEKEEDLGTVLVNLQQSMEQASSVDSSTKEVMKDIESALKGEGSPVPRENVNSLFSTATVATGRAIQNTGQAISDVVVSIKDTMMSHVDEVLGEAKTEIIDPLLGLSKSIFSFGQGLFGSLFGEDENTEEKRQTSILGSIRNILSRGTRTSAQTLDFFQAEEKEEDRMGKEKGGLLAGMGSFLSELMPEFGGGLLSGLAIAGGILGSLTKLGIAGLILGGIIMTIYDGIQGWIKSEEWGTSKIAGLIGGILGGGEGGLKNAFKNAGKWAGIGAAAGLAFGIPGMIAGAFIGAALGGLMGYFGGKKMARLVDEGIKTLMGEGSQGVWSTLATGSSWAMIGAMAGFAFGPPGMVVGALIGAALGGLMAWLGGSNIVSMAKDIGSKLMEGLSWENIKSVGGIIKDKIVESMKDLAEGIGKMFSWDNIKRVLYFATPEPLRFILPFEAEDKWFVEKGEKKIPDVSTQAAETEQAKDRYRSVMGGQANALSLNFLAGDEGNKEKEKKKGREDKDEGDKMEMGDMNVGIADTKGRDFIDPPDELDFAFANFMNRSVGP